MNYDVIVIGLGAMGSATAYELAARGRRVLGLEMFSRAHPLGSSGGLTRIIRLAYFEHEHYVPLLRAAWSGWQELQARVGRQLLLQTGGLYAGRRGSAVLEGSAHSAREHDLPHEMLSASEVRARFPALTLDADMAALHEPMAGMLFPEQCVATHLELAVQNGAELHFEERVLGWESSGEGVAVRTEHAEYRADRLVLSAGAWLPRLAPELDLPLTVERNVLFWFDPVDAEVLAPERLPVYIVDVDAERTFYGFAALPDQGAKVARHHGGTPTDPDHVEREATADDEAPVRDFMRRYLPAANGPRLDSRVCMYTNTPDNDFIIDLHPADPRVVVCSPCSGHGFKFSNVVGRISADLALDGGTDFEIGFLSVDRFGKAPAVDTIPA